MTEALFRRLFVFMADEDKRWGGRTKGRKRMTEQTRLRLCGVHVSRDVCIQHRTHTQIFIQSSRVDEQTETELE
jgi:hypothetical protein